MPHLLTLTVALVAAGTAAAAGPTTGLGTPTTGTALQQHHHHRPHLTPAEKAKLEALMKEIRANHAGNKTGAIEK